MYEKFYKLTQSPFSLTADPSFLCMTAQHREALSGLVYGVCTRPGLTVLVGEVGTGKTTLLYTLLDSLQKKHYITALCTNPILSREEFYDYLLRKLEIPCSSSLKSQQLIALQETLLRDIRAGRPRVLIVDEAQKLSIEILEEIRLLTNLETPREKLLQIIMAGQPELLEVFRQPELRQLKQRISYICKLQPLGLPEVREYIQHRLACAGLPAQTLFSPACIQQIFEFTNGIPRLLNSLCDNALSTGFALQSPQITIPIIREAATDLDLRSSGAQPHQKEAKAPAAVVADSQRTVEPLPFVAVGSDAEDREKPPQRVPFENYVARQKSLGFLASLLDRNK